MLSTPVTVFERNNPGKNFAHTYKLTLLKVTLLHSKYYDKFKNPAHVTFRQQQVGIQTG